MAICEEDAPKSFNNRIEREISEALAGIGVEVPDLDRRVVGGGDPVAEISRTISHRYSRASARLLWPTIKRVRARTEALSYRRQLLCPESEGDVFEALWWLAERGEASDLVAVREFRESGSPQSENVRQVADLTETKMLERIVRSGLSTRGSLRPRGGVQEGAVSRGDQEMRLELLERTRSANKSIASQAILALGEWGGGEDAAAVGAILEHGGDEEIQLYCITSLGILGGPDAVRSLSWAIANGSEAVRRAAVRAIEDLISGGSFEDTERPPHAEVFHAAAMDEQLKTILIRALRELAADYRDSAYMRGRAGRLIRFLNTP